LETIVRVNTLKASREEVITCLVHHLQTDQFRVSAHPSVEEAVVITGKSEAPLVQRAVSTVVVGEMCGLAVLRGADVFSPGILSLAPSVSAGQQVSVLADVNNKCLKGAKLFDGDTRHVGNGVIRVSREQLFKAGTAAQGVGVEITERRYPCPSLDESLFSGLFMLQNLPSIIAVDMLGPEPGERVLDMCAAPGGKTTHIAQRMKNSGLVVACDKSNNKVRNIDINCSRLGVTNVRSFALDATKCLATGGAARDDNESDASVSPPFPRQYFDRVLLDAPCSALGQRPQFYNKIKIKELDSFPKIQRKLFNTAVELLAPGGVLVYSTCTNNVEENDNLVSWASSNFPHILEVDRKTFGRPTAELDTITFFISKFIKKK